MASMPVDRRYCYWCFSASSSICCAAARNHWAMQRQLLRVSSPRRARASNFSAPTSAPSAKSSRSLVVLSRLSKVTSCSMPDHPVRFPADMKFCWLLPLRRPRTIADPMVLAGTLHTKCADFLAPARQPPNRYGVPLPPETESTLWASSPFPLPYSIGCAHNYPALPLVRPPPATACPPHLRGGGTAGPVTGLISRNRLRSIRSGLALSAFAFSIGRAFPLATGAVSFGLPVMTAP